MNKNAIFRLFARYQFHSLEKKYNLDINKYMKRTSDFSVLIPQLPKGSTVLDIGAGHGWFSFLLSGEFSYETYALDIKFDSYTRKSFQKYNINYKETDMLKGLPFPDNYFDAVFFMEVLEHLITRHPPYYIFKEIRRVLKSNGWLVMSTPNALCISNRLTCLLGIRPPSISYTFFNSEIGRGENLPYIDHLREYSVKELVYILTKMKYNIVDIIFTNQSPPSRDLFGSFCKVLAKLYPNFRNTIIIRSRATKSHLKCV